MTDETNTIPSRVDETDVDDIGECATEPRIHITEKEEAAPATVRFGTNTANAPASVSE